MSTKPPIDHPLTEKLRWLQTYSFPYNGNYYVRWDDVLKICREYFSQQNQTSEISVVNESGLRQQIEVALALGRAGKVDPVDALVRVIRPYLRTTEPVSASEISDNNRVEFERKASENGFVMVRKGDGYFNDALHWCWLFWCHALKQQHKPVLSDMQKERDFLFDLAVTQDAHRLCDHGDGRIIFKEQLPRSKEHIEYLLRMARND